MKLEQLVDPQTLFAESTKHEALSAIRRTISGLATDWSDRAERTYAEPERACYREFAAQLLAVAGALKTGQP